MYMPAASFTDRLNTARERLGIALDPAARAARSGREAGAVLDVGGRSYAQPADGTIMINDKVVTPDMSRLQGYGFTGREATPDQVAVGLARSAAMNAPATDPNAPAEPAAPVAMPRPAGNFTAAQAMSRTGLGPDGKPSRSVLPVGNLPARDAMLRAAFPNASRRELQGLGDFAYYQPEAFNAATAGSSLDPSVASARAMQAEVSLASTLQDMNFKREQQPLALASQRLGMQGTAQGMQISAEEAARRAATDKAAQGFFAANEDPAISAAAKAGAPAATLFDMASVARQRADEARRIEMSKPKETTLLGRQAVVTNGNVQFANEPKEPALTQLARLRAERAQALTAGDAEGVQIYDRAIENEVSRPTNFIESAMNRGAGAQTPAAAKPAPAKPAAPAKAAAPAVDKMAQAREWLAKNPDHPLAAGVRKKLGQ